MIPLRFVTLREMHVSGSFPNSFSMLYHTDLPMYVLTGLFIYPSTYTHELPGLGISYCLSPICLPPTV